MRLVAQRKETKKVSFAAKIAAVCCSSLVLAGCIGFGFASAGLSASTGNAVFGLGKTTSTQIVAPAVAAEDEFVVEDPDIITAGVSIESTAQRNVTVGVEEIAAEEEAARIAAEKAAMEKAQAAREAQLAKEGALALTPVDFSIGKEAFMAEWTTRIDNYLAGSPLAGYGAVFAEAAWENGVDPRFSPAISNTESSKGRNCFKYHNAWGWGQSSWGSWEEAINAHVTGLSEGYGHTISVANAKKYCPPTYLDWYQKTLSQMQII